MTSDHPKHSIAQPAHWVRPRKHPDQKRNLRPPPMGSLGESLPTEIENPPFGSGEYDLSGSGKSPLFAFPAPTGGPLGSEKAMLPIPVTFKVNGLAASGLILCEAGRVLGTTDCSSADATVKAKMKGKPKRVGLNFMSTFNP